MKRTIALLLLSALLAGFLPGIAGCVSRIPADSLPTVGSGDTVAPPADPPADTPVQTPPADAPVQTPPAETEPPSPPFAPPLDCPTDELPVISVDTEGVAVDSRDYVDMTLTLWNTEDCLPDVPAFPALRLPPPMPTPR